MDTLYQEINGTLAMPPNYAGDQSGEKLALQNHNIVRLANSKRTHIPIYHYGELSPKRNDVGTYYAGRYNRT